jgi:hypothetical protein
MYSGALADLNLAANPWNNNRYAFAGGNPITGIELDGHRPLGQCDGPCSPTNAGQQVSPLTGQVTGTQWTPDDDRPTTVTDEPVEKWPVTEFDVWLWHQSKELDYESSWVRTYFDTFLWEQMNAPDTPEPDETGNVLLDHGYLQVTGCWIFCLSSSTQGGHVQIQGGGFGLGGWGGTGGINEAKVEEQGLVQGVACGGKYVVGCVQGGPGAEGHDPWIGAGVGGTYGVGGQIGGMLTIIDVGESRVRLFAWELWSW